MTGHFFPGSCHLQGTSLPRGKVTIRIKGHREQCLGHHRPSQCQEQPQPVCAATLCVAEAHLGNPLQQRFQPSLVTLAVTVQEGQDLGLCGVSTPDSRAHQTCEDKFKVHEGRELHQRAFLHGQQHGCPVTEGLHISCGCNSRSAVPGADPQQDFNLPKAMTPRKVFI